MKRPNKSMTDDELFDAIREQVNRSRNGQGHGRPGRPPSSPPPCSAATAAKMADALRQVLEQPWGGYWPFIDPCWEALKEYEQQNDQVSGGANDQLV